MITENLGKISITPKGQWVAGSYERLDMVTNAGSSYLSLKDANSSILTVTADWMLVAEKGDAFEYADFTPEQIALLKGDKGDPFLYSDFTPAQIAELQQPAADAIASIEAVELSVEQAEALRVQAEIDRQTNTGTAIQNAETATTNASDAAILANTKAGLADSKATLADQKATLANDAATLANTKAGLADTAATNANNVANGYAAELALKEVKANKQNSLATDGTGTKFPTVDAVNAGLAAKQDANLIASYVHSGNLEVAIQSINIATNTFTKTAHGLINGDRVAPTLNIDVVDAYPYNVYPIGLANPDNGYYVINAAPDTFQLSLTSGGASITLSVNATMNLSKWHFEKRVELVYENTNILLSTDFRIVYGLRILTASNLYSYNGLSGIWGGNDYYPSSSNYNNTYVYPYTPIAPCHFGHGEQKFMAHYKMNTIHLVARIYQTGIVDRLSMKFIDFTKTVNSDAVQLKTLRLSGIFPANGFSFKIYKI